MPANIVRKPKLQRAAPQPMQLEQRFMFDGAAAADAVQVVNRTAGDSPQPAFADLFAESSLTTAPTTARSPEPTRNSSELAADETAQASAARLFTLATNAPDTPAVVLEAIAQVEQTVADFLRQPGLEAQLFSVFNGNETGSTPSQAWLERAQALSESLLQGDWNIRLELRSASELQQALGAFASHGPAGQSVIFLNADWLANGASAKALELVLAEEFGHALDTCLNPAGDTIGDEGQAFAGLLFYGDANLAVTRGIADHNTLILDGQAIGVENAAPYVIAQTHYVPMAEPDIQTSLKAISTAVTGNIQTVIAITATSNGTVVVYDQWEDGYEADISNPVQASTKIWTYNGNQWFVDTNGDGTQNNGETAVSGTGITVSGNSIILSNAVNPASPATVDFDGRDKIGSTKAVSVTRAGWSITPGTVLAGAVNVIDAGNAGKVYTLPVGQNVTTVATGTDKLFEYTSAHIIASQNGTTVAVDKDGNGTTDLTITLNEGQSYLVSGGLNAGAKISADKGVGVYLIAGDVGSSYENRWFALTPDEQWSSSYYAPVSTTLAADPAYVIVYNPNSSPITVKWDTAAGAQSALTVAANSTGYALMPGSAAHFYTQGTGGAAAPKFFAVGVIDADATANQTHDWSYSLVPESYLTDKFVVGWGPGADNVTRSLAGTDLNGSPVWMTPTQDTTIYVKSSTVTVKDGAGNAVTGTLDATTGDYKYVVKQLQSYRLFDADKDQTGLTVYTKDGTLITAAWGEDPSIAGAGAPYLDMGTTVTPFPDYVLSKESVENNPADANTVVELGERVKYTVRLTNRAVIDLFNIVLRDTISPADSATYVPDSTVLTVYNPDGTKAWKIEGTTQTFYNADGTVASTATNNSLAGNNFPLSSAGYSITDLDPSTPSTVDGLKRGGVVEITYEVQIRNNINKALADSDYTVTNSVNMSGTGASKDKENGTQITVNVTDGEVFLMDAGYTSNATSYTPGSTIGLQVTDGDQNTNAAVAETITVNVTNTSTNEVETRTLTETGVNTGVFRGSLATSSSSGAGNSNGTLLVTVGNSLKVEYVDPKSGGASTTDATGIDNPTNWGITPITYQTGNNSNLKTAVIANAPPPPATDGKIELLDASFGSTSVNFTEGSTLGIQVTDADQNSDTGTQQTLTVTVTNATTGETESVTLTETGANTGIFRGTLATSTASSAAANNSGSLRMVLGDLIQADYTDPITGATFDNPTKPGITSPYTTGNANRDTATVVKTKTLYLSATGDLDRVDPVATSDATTATTSTLDPAISSIRTISDDFGNSASYAGGSGWASGVAWTETGETTSSPTNGFITLQNGSGKVVSGYGLMFAGTSNSTVRLTRSFDALTASGTLTFDYKVEKIDASDLGLLIEYSTDGATWSTVGTLTGRLSTGGTDSGFTAYPNDSTNGNATAVIAALPTGAAYIRFSYNTSSNKDKLYVDNISISSTVTTAATPTTFTQALPMATALTLPASGVVGITTHVSAETGLTSGTYAGITAALTYNAGSGDVTIATLGSATYAESGTAGVGTLTWSGDVGNSALTIPKGANVKLVITNTVASSSFKIDYDSSSKPSRIDLPVTNVIEIVDVDGVDTNNDGDTLDAGEGTGTVAGVQEIGFFDKSSSAGGSAQISAGSIDAGGTVYIRVKVKDPFGAYDINSLKLSIDGPGTTGDIGTATPVSATVVGTPANGDTYKTFEYAWQTVNNTGEYTVTVTAAEGFEGTVTDLATGSFTVTAKDLGTPSITQFITALSGADAGATYAQGANAFLRVTDLDEASATAGKTITAVVNGTSFSLTQTGANTGIFEAALTGTGFTTLPQGTVLTASYTDPDDATDTSGDTISVPVPSNTAPTATANARTINENQTASGTNLITSNEGSGSDTDADAADIPSLRVTAVNGGGISQTSSSTVTTVNLPSGARLDVAPNGSYTYNPNGAFNYLGASQSATDSFTYSISDGRGGTATATVTITINGLADPSATVTDSNGATLGDNSIAENATSPVTGSFTLSAPAGLGSITVNGTSVTAGQLSALGATPVAITTAEGTITLTAYNAGTGVVTYSYGQSGTSKNHSGGDTSVVDSIPLTITDSSGTNVNAESIDILITDTAPTANADTDSVTEDGTTTATGNVITAAVIGVTNDANTTDGAADTLGADTATVTGVQAGIVATQITTGAASAINGTYGRLTVNANGDYTYTLYTSSDTGAGATGYAALQAIAKGQSQTDVFSYTLKDADGDFSNTTVTVTVNGSNDTPVITVVDVTGAVTEDVSVVADNPTTVAVESGAFVSDSGSVTFDDVDLSDTSTVTATLQITNYFDWAAISNNGGGNWPGTLSGRLYKATYDTQAGRTLTNAEFIALGYELMSQSNGTIGAFVVNFTDNTQTTIDYIVSKASATGIVDRPAGTDPTNANTTVTGQRVYLNSADVASAQTTLGRSATVSNPSTALNALATALQLSGAGTGTAAHSGTVNWTFAIDNNQIQYLTGGESLVATYRLIVKDNSTTTPVTATDNHNVAIRLVTVTIAGANEAPVIDLDTTNTNTFNRTATFNVGGNAVAFAAGATNLTDADSTTFDKLSLSWTAANFPDGASERLLINGATAGGTIVGLGTLSSGGTITLASNPAVAYNVSSSGGVITVVFTGAAGAELTQSQAEELIDALRYENNAASPTTGSSRVFSLKPTDGSALDGNTATFSVNVAVSATLSINNVTVSESAGNATFTATRDGDTSTAVSASYSTSSGSATSNTDFTASSGTVTFAAGESSKTISVPVTNDTVYESSEIFNVTLSAPNGATISTAVGVGTILDDGSGPDPDGGGPLTPDDDRPTLSVSGMNVEEGSRATFTVTLSNAIKANTVIDLALSNVDTTSADFNGTTYEWSEDGGTTWNTVASNQITLTGGKTAFKVRVATSADSEFEGAEAFKLTASFNAATLKFADGLSGTTRSGYSANANSTIYDDGSIDGDDSGTTPDDDRALTVNSITVNEGNGTNYAVFTVTANVGQTLTLTLGDGTVNPTATSGTDYTNSLEYWNGTAWTSYTAGFTVPGTGTGSTALLVRVAVSTDTTFEQAEDFKLTAAYTSGAARSATGTATIVDDGTGTKFTNGNPTGSTPATDATNLDDDRALTVNSITVNEGNGTNYAVFTVTANVGQTLTLALSDGTVNPTATSGTDYTNSLEYWNGTAWTSYTAAFAVPGTGTGSTALLVRVAVSTDTTFEQAEDFKLTAAYTSGAARSATGTATIVDDGTGTKFTNGNPTGSTPATDATNLDDDRALTVNSITVNEGNGTNYAVFTVTANVGQTLTLALSDGTVNPTATSGTDYTNSLEYWNGSAWTSYTAAFAVPGTGTGSTALLVRVAVSTDTTFEKTEDFKLTAAYTAGAARSATGTATIVDDGTGTKFTSGNPTGSTPATDATNLDDDRALTVNSITVNEGNGTNYAVFTVTANVGQTLTLALSDGTVNPTATSGTDYTNSLEYWNGTAWTSYTAAFAVPGTGTGSTALLVRVAVSTDTTFEKAEDFKLTAAYTAGAARSATGTATIVDDGTGTKFTSGNPTGSTPATDATNLDDDRALTVNSITVNEGNGTNYAVFTVTANVGQTLTLALSDGTVNPTATSGTDYTNSLEYWNGTAWTSYTAAFAVPGTGTGSTALLVRVAVSTDTTFEKAEDFKLTAAYTAGAARSATGTATIVDDGTGTKFTNGNPTGSTPATDATNLDDDRALTVNSITVNEGNGTNYAVFTVTANVGQTLTLALSDGTVNPTATSGTDYTNSLEYWNGTAWTSYTAAFAVPGTGTGSTALLVRVAVSTDTTFEKAEDFKLTAAYTSGAARSATGTATIVDDGTGTKFTNGNPTGSTPATDATNLDDDRALTVNSITVNEGSGYAVFTVSANAGQTLTLALSDGTVNPTATSGTDYTNSLEYWNGTAWTTYTAGFTVPGTTNAAVSLYVRVAITNDTTFENAEDFKLTAAYTSGTARSATGVATIVDDGTGNKWTDAPPSTPPTAGPGADFDDDRPLAVNDIEISESSPFAIFKVSGGSGQFVKLELLSGTATIGTDTGSALEYYNGTSWQAYTPGSFVRIPVGATTLLVRIPVVNDAELEHRETFQLKATSVSGRSALGTAAIYDDGSNGSRFDATNTSGNPTVGEANDDTPPPIIPLQVTPAAVTSATPAPPPSTTVTPVAPAGEVRFIEQVSQPRVEPPANTGTPDLRVVRNIPDQSIGNTSGRLINFAIPADTFEHTDRAATITITATMVDGTALPNWLLFDPNRGQFRGTPPQQFTGELVIKVMARDENGRQAETTVRIRVGADGEPLTFKGKASLTAQLRQQSVFAWKQERDKLLQRLHAVHQSERAVENPEPDAADRNAEKEPEPLEWIA